MKQKYNSSKKINCCIATSPLLRFMQFKRKKLKTNSSLKTIKKKMTGSKLYTITQSQCNKTDSEKISTTVKQELPTSGSIVQMQNTCKSKYENNSNISLCLFYESDKEDPDKFTSVKCLMSTGRPNEANPGTNMISDQNNSQLKNINEVRNHNTQVPESTLNKEKCLTKSVDATKTKGCISVCTSDKQVSTANVYELNYSKHLVVLQPENMFYFIGIVELELLQGSVEVLGFTFNEQRKKSMLFSTVGYSHLYIKSVKNKNDVGNNADVKIEDLLRLGLSEKFSREVLREKERCSIFILSRNKVHISYTVWTHFFETHLKFSIFPQSDLMGLDQEHRSSWLVESKIGCVLDGSIREKGKEFVELPDWLKVVEEITFQDSPKVVLCGGKSVGKSTFLRYIINRLLKKLNKILVLDFDLGQCEFTVGGCISATLVEEPVLGPNFSHLKQPLRSVFLGEVDVTKCPEDYIKGCKYLINFAEKEHGSIPWLVNTMGFSRGFGVTLTCGIIKNVKPTNVIQIESKDKKCNFPSLLEPGFVYTQDVGSFSTTENISNCVYRLHVLQSAAEYQTYSSQKIRGISPLEARNLVILSYLSNLLNLETTSLSQVTPFMINMEHIDLKTTNKGNLSKIQIAAIMNGTLVALCSQNDDVFPNCLGFGIVRGIDMQSGVLFLITPVAGSVLKKTNCLIKGNVNLPESLHYNQGHHVEGHVPYMAHTSGGSTALFAKRDYRILPAVPRESRKNQSM